MSRRRLTAVAAALVVVVGLVAAILVAREADDDEPGQQPGGAVVWAVGDGADGSDRAHEVAELVSAQPFDRFLYLGDVYADGTREEFENHFDAIYGEFADRAAPAPGNHEWETRDEGYLPYWEEQRGDPIEPWYAFELGGWELLSLNSEEPVGPGSPQHEWLERELAEPGTCRIAFWHSPRFSASPDNHGDDPAMEPLWDALEGRATLVLGAHDHNMQRFEPVGGLTQFVSGAGGNHLYKVEDDPRLAFGNDDDYGALRLSLRPGVADHAFVTVDGREVDSGRVSCQER